MSDKVNIVMPKCMSCNRIITPGEDSTKTNCPNCGEILIWRCAKCRQFGRNYRCPQCSFTGP